MPDTTPSMPPLPEPDAIRVTWLSDGPDGQEWSQYHDDGDPVPPEWDDEAPDLATPLFGTGKMNAYAQAVADARVREAMSGVLEALEAGHDALAAEAKQYHASMAGYRPLVHQALDAEVASVAAVLERVRSLAGKEGTT